MLSFAGGIRVFRRVSLRRERDVLFRQSYGKICKRPLSASSAKTGAASGESERAQLLYQRSSENNRLPRAALGFSTFNTVYWAWYCFDFIPAINASPIDSLHVDPKIGWGALGLGIAINSLAAFYPSTLVSKVEFLPNSKELRVYGLSLPILSASSRPKDYNLGDIKLDPASADIRRILNHHEGDLRRYRGHLPLLITNHSVPWLLEVREGQVEVLNGEILLQALLNQHSLRNPKGKDRSKKTSRSTKKKRSTR